MLNKNGLWRKQSINKTSLAAKEAYNPHKRIGKQHENSHYGWQDWGQGIHLQANRLFKSKIEKY